MWLLIPLIALSGAAHIVSDYTERRQCSYVFKPLTVLLIVCLLGFAPESVYRNWLFAALGFSLLGDVFLMMRKDYFIAGLVSFLLVHVIYSTAFFAQVAQVAFTVWHLFPMLYAVIMLILLWPGLGKLKLPVVIYVIAIVSMMEAALSLVLFAEPTPLSTGPFATSPFATAPSATGQLTTDQYSTAPWFALAGAIIFAISDSLLAWRRFKFDWPSGQAAVMSTYYSAQLLIVLSAFAV